MFPIEYRVYASNHEFPEGKMFYPETMHKEVDKDRGFVMNQFGNLIHTYYKGNRSHSVDHVWARIGFNDVHIMFALPNQKDINDKQMWEEDIVKIHGGINDGKVGVLLYDEEYAGFIIKGDDDLLQQLWGTFGIVKFEVIGNTHEVKENE